MLLVDAHAHASVHAGAAASRGTVSRFRHNDLDSLRRAAGDGLDPRAGAVVVVDGVYSMTGELAPLAGIAALCDRFGARLVVDEAHGLRRPRRDGRGAAEQAGVLDRVDAVTDRLQQVAGQRRRRGDDLAARPPTASAPPRCPTCSAPPTTRPRWAPRWPPCGSCAASRSGWSRTRENGELLRRSLADAGVPPLPGRGAVIAVPTGEEEVTADRLAVPPSRPASTSTRSPIPPSRAGQGVLRLSVHGHAHRRAAAHGRRDRRRGGRASAPCRGPAPVA